MQATIEEVSDILGNAEELVRWWPSVYLRVQEIEPGDANGVGKVVQLHTKGYLPYTLKWSFRVTESNKPHGFALEAWGDFVGTGRWTFEQDGDFANITYDWQVRADKPILRWFSFILKPLFSWNHHWAMRQGEMSLRKELETRRQVDGEIRRRSTYSATS